MITRRPRAIETVFLDAGGVLVHPDTTRVAACLADIDHLNVVSKRISSMKAI